MIRPFEMWLHITASGFILILVVLGLAVVGAGVILWAIIHALIRLYRRRHA